MRNLNRTRLAMTAALMVAGLGFTACSEEAEEIGQSEEITTEVSSTTIQADGEMELESVFELVEDELAIINESLEGGRLNREQRILPACATVDHDQENSRVVIDFGEENCLGKDGLYRRGKIVVEYNGRKREPGSTRRVTLVDYFINDHELTGTKNITNVSEMAGVPKFTVVVTDASFTNEAGTVTWSSNRTITLTEGADTPHNPFDDKINITGTSSGTNRRGVAYTFTVREPLVRIVDRGCARTFEDGLVDYENENGLAWTLDYDPFGGQPCDRLGVVTIGERTYTITLR